MSRWFPDFRRNWSDALRDSSFRAQSFLTVVLILTMVLFISRYFEFIQSRPGVYIHDPLLQRIPAQDLSVYTFIVLYSSIGIFLFSVLGNPRLVICTLQAYFVLMVFRIITMYFLPLEPSQEMIPLNDPFVENFIYKNKMISKDLFFSGHVSTMFLLFLVSPKWRLKLYFLAATIAVAVLILVQHVHYTIDVIVAPIFTVASYYIVRQAYSKEDR
ncbi:MAG TPA: phosphatase PAP2-related protein [Chitinophagales bacterium]|nr:phosphatase PAP2-related protein [Chitinophagales bacterium]